MGKFLHFVWKNVYIFPATVLLDVTETSLLPFLSGYWSSPGCKAFVQFSSPLQLRWGEQRRGHLRNRCLLCAALFLEASEQPLVAGSSVLAFQRWPRSTNSLCVAAFYTLLSVSMCVFLLQAPFLPFLVFLHEIKHHWTFSDWLNPSSCPSCRGFANIAVLLLMQSLSKAFWSYLAILYTQWLKDDESFQVAGDVIISPVSQLEDGGVTSAA